MGGAKRKGAELRQVQQVQQLRIGRAWLHVAERNCFNSIISYANILPHSETRPIARKFALRERRRRFRNGGLHTTPRLDSAREADKESAR